MGTVKKRDISVEMLRILAAWMVIGTHIKLAAEIDQSVSGYRVLAACLVADGVAVFWMILGFFFFQKSYRDSLESMFRRIVIPLFVYSAAMFFFYDYLAGIDDTLLESIHHPRSEWIDVLVRGVLRWEPTLPGTEHLWYLYIYILVIALYPALKGIHEQFSRIRNGDLILFLLIVGILVWNDLTFNEMAEFSHHTFRGVCAGSLFVLAGEILYRRRDRLLSGWWIGAAGLACFLLACGVRYLVQADRYRSTFVTEAPLYWYTCYSLAAVVGLCAFVMKTAPLLDRSPLAGGLVRHVASRTFDIYLFHRVIITFCNHRGIRDRLLDRLGYSGPGVLVYTAVYSAFIFLLSLAVSEVLFLALRLLKRAVPAVRSLVARKP